MTLQVLIVEDSLTVRMHLHEALEQAGFKVASCSTVAEGRRALAAHKFPLVILDVQLPDGEGLDILRDIRTDPEQRDAAVMLLSTEAEVGDRLRGLNMGADEYIGKPYDLGFVIGRAREFLQPKNDADAQADTRDTVVVIDDSLTFRAALKEALETAGYRVFTAENGEAGLRLANQIRPAAVVVDGVMPGIDGATVIRRIRLDAALRYTPCLLLTASDGKDAEIEALEAGADAFVLKDIDPSLVIARLRAVVRGSSATGHRSTPSLQAPKRVLAVDDSETYLQELAGSLRSEGYDVILARSGEEALDLLAVQPVDCVLLDLLMPGIGGHDVCRRIKGSVLTRHIPVLILTAQDDQQSTIEGLSAGADDYIAKSSEFKVLRARVLAQLRRKQIEDEHRSIREQMLHREIELTESRAARELAEARASLIERDKILAQEADRAKSRFLAAMSHEIRTPMNGVIGMVELLLTTSLSDEQRQMVDVIRTSGVTLLDVINDILDYSKIEAGRMTVERIPFSLVEIVETTAQLITAQAQSKSIEVACYIDPTIDEVVLGDPVRVRQIILNLMGNAVKFTEHGTIRVDAIAEVVTAEEFTMLVEVTDSGVGMNGEEQARLFQPFQQANQSTTRKYGGTGLGLSICKNLVELMGGQIGVRSAVGKGSTFWYRIKFGRQADAVRMSNYTSVLSGLRAMVFSAKSQGIASLYLRAQDVDVIDCHDEAKAIEYLDTEMRALQPLDLVVIHDHASRDGARSLMSLLNQHPTLKKTRVLAIVPPLNAASVIESDDMTRFVMSAPVRRTNFYEQVAFATGRAAKRTVAQEAFGTLDFTAPSIEDARAAGALVLVAEDNRTNQFVISNQLRRLGIACEFVNDGRDAWDALSRDDARYGLLLTDCQMPFIDGYKLTGLVRDREIATGRRLPIVALTANALSGEADICRASGMDDYLSKPTTLESLDAMITKWLPAAIARRQRNSADARVRKSSQQTTEHGTPQAIDIAGLAEAIDGPDDTFAMKMLALFRSSEANTGEELKAVIEARDSAMLTEKAHAAKGAAQTACANRLAELLGELEESAKNPNWRRIDTLRQDIDTEFARVMSFIDTFVGGAAPPESSRH